MAWAVVRLYGFRVTEVGDDLRIEYGLLTRFTATVPVRRIQSVTITEGPLYRLADRVSVRVETAGGRAGQDSAASVREWLAPLLRPAQLGPLLAEVMREEPGAVGLDRAHPRAFRRAVKRRVLSGNRADARRRASHSGGGACSSGSSRSRGACWRRGATWITWDGWPRAAWWRSGAAGSGERDDRARVADPGGDAASNRRSIGAPRWRAFAWIRPAPTNDPHRIDIPYLARDGAAALQSRLAAQAADTEFQW